MADILIKGLCLSKDWEMISINISRDGKVSRSYDLNGGKIAEAIINPPSGRWIKMSDADGVFWACSECGEYLPRVSHFSPQFDLFPRYKSIDKTPYCPNCGAKMDRDDNA